MSQSKVKDLSRGQKGKASYRDKAQREICNCDVGEDPNCVVLFDGCSAIFEVGHSRDLLVLFVRGATSFGKGIYSHHPGALRSLQSFAEFCREYSPRFRGVCRIAQ
jgi:hypothetical protein